MAGRLVRKTVILAKLEPIYGQDALPSPAENALVISNRSITPLNADYVKRDIIREYLGASEELPNAGYVECSFDVELVGAGTVAKAPAWGPLMRAVGFAETVTAGMRVDYTPISGNFESATIYYYDDGVLHKLLGARGTATLDLTVGQIPKISYKFIAVDGGLAALANPTTTLTAWRVPQIVTDENSGDITIGATHAVATAPLLVGGKTYPSQGLTIDLGVVATFQKLLGGSSAEITDREVTGAMKLKLTAAEEVAFMADVKSVKKSTIGLIHGTVANDKVGVFLPAAQLKDPTKEELNGERLVGYKIRALPAAGNDEFRIFTSFA